MSDAKRHLRQLLLLSRQTDDNTKKTPVKSTEERIKELEGEIKVMRDTELDAEAEDYDAIEWELLPAVEDRRPGQRRSLNDYVHQNPLLPGYSSNPLLPSLWAPQQSRALARSGLKVHDLRAQRAYQNQMRQDYYQLMRQAYDIRLREMKAQYRKKLFQHIESRQSAFDRSLRPEEMTVVTIAELPGYTVERVLGITSGSHAWQIPGLEDDELLHHDATAHGDLASAARAKAYEKLIARTRNAGGNAIVNFLYDTRSLSATVMEVIASGTALKVTKDKKDGEEEGEKDDGGDAGKTAKGDDGKEKSLTATEGLIKVLMELRIKEDKEADDARQKKELARVLRHYFEDEEKREENEGPTWAERLFGQSGYGTGEQKGAWGSDPPKTEDQDSSDPAPVIPAYEDLWGVEKQAPVDAPKQDTDIPPEDAGWHGDNDAPASALAEVKTRTPKAKSPPARTSAGHPQATAVEKKQDSSSIAGWGSAAPAQDAGAAGDEGNWDIESVPRGKADGTTGNGW